MKNIENFMPQEPLRTAVLFLVFNRPDTTQQVLEAIRMAKPPRLYLAADGARADREGEAQKVQAVRDLVLECIDWDCEVKTLFRTHNHGCKMAVSGAIDWFFEQEEMGIILEDDCLPSQSFFWFCEAMLERHRNDMRVGYITGSNFYTQVGDDEYSYHYTKIAPIWGWAAWRRSWNLYDRDLQRYARFKETRYMKELYYSEAEYRMWIDRLEPCLLGVRNTWDFQWGFTQRINHMLCIKPNVNLIRNIGFGADATHTTASAPEEYLSAGELRFPLKHFPMVIPDVHADKMHLKQTLHRKQTPRQIMARGVRAFKKKYAPLMRFWERNVWLSRNIKCHCNNEGPEKILVIGDSHAEIFLDGGLQGSFPGCCFCVTAVGGATASGLKNPNSITRAYRIFQYALKKERYAKIVIHLGEVDTGYVLWYKHMKNPAESMEALLQKTVETYTGFITDAARHAGVIVISTPLPTIGDGVAMGEVANLRKAVEIPLAQRTALTLKFNAMVQEFCVTNAIDYISLDAEVMDGEGMVKHAMRSKDPTDHHYDKQAYRTMIVHHLKPKLKQEEC